MIHIPISELMFNRAKTRKMSIFLSLFSFQIKHAFKKMADELQLFHYTYQCQANYFLEIN